MDVDSQFAETAALIAEPARAIMLWNLLEGRAYTAGELALVSNLSPQGASNHLNKLVDANMLKVEKQGKHRYYRFARPEVAYAVEAIANLIPEKKIIGKQNDFKNGDIQYARTCYDHLAGNVAVLIEDAILKNGLLRKDNDSYEVTDKGEQWFAELDISVDELKNQRRSFAYTCLDWTERKHHIAGALGAAMLKTFIDKQWIRKTKLSRKAIVTAEGSKRLYELLKIEV